MSFKSLLADLNIPIEQLQFCSQPQGNVSCYLAGVQEFIQQDDILFLLHISGKGEDVFSAINNLEENIRLAISENRIRVPKKLSDEEQQQAPADLIFDEMLNVTPKSKIVARAQAAANRTRQRHYLYRMPNAMTNDMLRLAKTIESDKDRIAFEDKIITRDTGHWLWSDEEPDDGSPYEIIEPKARKQVEPRKPSRKPVRKKVSAQ